MIDIIILGNGGHSRSCIDVIEAEQKYNILGIVSNDKNTVVKNYPILGTDCDLEKLKFKCENIIIAIGSIKNSILRKQKYETLKRIGFKFPTIISPIAYISPSAKIGEGSIIMHHAMVNSCSIIGNNCIINSKSLIEHDVRIGNHVHISTSAIVNGSTQIGDGTFVGSNAVTKEGLKIGKGCIISAGSFVNKNILEGKVFK